MIQKNIDNHSKRKRILAVHLYRADKLGKLLVKLKLLLDSVDEVWLSSSKKDLLENACTLFSRYTARVKCLLVDNAWNDWSGYLEFFRQYDGVSLLIICNDSIVSRRFVGHLTLRSFLNSLATDDPAVVGELDSSLVSVDLNGWSSASWISTYLFSVQGMGFDLKALERDVLNDVELAMADPDHVFNRYLASRRLSTVLTSEARVSKLGAMFFERRLTRLSIESGVKIVNFTAGQNARKIERFFERFLDG